MDAKSDRDDSAGSSDTQSLVLGSIFYTKPPGFAQGGDQKSYCGRTEGFLSQWNDGLLARPAGRGRRLYSGKLASIAAYNAC